ncbi:periphilin-1 isoform X2 [Corythoichthys intestinalis]|uniref:periphilin-1 isoform X2 n=1 Tax=Corythoichthys intestinalis TaxID=161448 RepID=UPI0025A56D03|nr:periphilin-1 isoform X2 [Corythoichthys intestinalis]
MTYRRERSIRDAYEERFMPERAARGQYSRGGERRSHFGRPDNYDYEGGPRFFPNGGGPRNYHGEDQRGYHGDGGGHFPSERRGGPPSRRDDYSYRGPREEQHTGRPMEYNNRAPPPRTQGMYPAARSLPESGSDTLMQAILNLDRGDERQDYRRKAPPFPTPRDRSPHSRSGSSVSSRGYSPDRSKSLPFSSQQGKKKIPGLSREGSPSSAISNKEENIAPEVEKEDPSAITIIEEVPKTTTDNLKERRAQAIAAKAKDIEKVFKATERHITYRRNTRSLKTSKINLQQMERAIARAFSAFVTRVPPLDITGATIHQNGDISQILCSLKVHRYCFKKVSLFQNGLLAKYSIRVVSAFVHLLPLSARVINRK